jgi:hypothetical protein
MKNEGKGNDYRIKHALIILYASKPNKTNGESCWRLKECNDLKSKRREFEILSYLPGSLKTVPLHDSQFHLLTLHSFLFSYSPSIKTWTHADEARPGLKGDRVHGRWKV